MYIDGVRDCRGCALPIRFSAPIDNSVGAGRGALDVTYNTYAQDCASRQDPRDFVQCLERLWIAKATAHGTGAKTKAF